MKSLSTFLNRIATWKSLLIFLAIDFLFVGYLLKNSENKITELAGKPIGIIDLTFGFSPQKTLMMVAEYGDAARAYYAWTEMTTDLVYPIAYAFLFGIILTLLYRETEYGWVNLIPFVCLTFDYLENISIVTLLISFPQQSLTVAILCESFKFIKWLTFAAVILLIIIGAILRVIRALKPRSEKKI